MFSTSTYLKPSVYREKFRRSERFLYDKHTLITKQIEEMQCFRFRRWINLIFSHFFRLFGAYLGSNRPTLSSPKCMCQQTNFGLLNSPIVLQSFRVVIPEIIQQLPYWFVWSKQMCSHSPVTSPLVTRWSLMSNKTAKRKRNVCLLLLCCF